MDIHRVRVVLPLVETGLRPGLPREPLDDPFWACKFGPMIPPEPLFRDLFKAVAR